jgi:hypothetical protein
MMTKALVLDQDLIDGLIQERHDRGIDVYNDIVTLGFRRKSTRNGPRIEVLRADGKPGRWTM